MPLINLIESLFIKIIQIFPPEISKNITLKFLKILYNFGLLKLFRKSKPNNISLMGLNFKNRIGIAGGLDKNGNYFHIFGLLGFGHVEVGTITLDPQKGNPKPRLFRFKKDLSLVNSLGFNNQGSLSVLSNIKKNKKNFNGILGISIGKSKNTKLEDAWKDYLSLMDFFYEDADYLAINISSPNTDKLRNLSSIDYLKFLLDKITQKRVQLSSMYTKFVPLVLKLSPDEEEKNLMNILQLVEEFKIDAVICTNTSSDNPYSLKGGLSGSLLKEKSEVTQNIVSKYLPEGVLLISSGGIMTGSDVKVRLDNSASLCQLYTGYIFSGQSLLEDALEVSSS